MVSYRKRGDVWQYEISYKDDDGKYKKLRKSGFKLKSDAILAASEIQTLHPKLSKVKSSQQTLVQYFENWISIYKKDIVTNITYIKYTNALNHIRQLFGNIKLNELTKGIYQEKLNIFAQTHSKRTVSGFHKQIRACLLDALDEKIIASDPTRKAIITGRDFHPAQKALNYADWLKLTDSLSTTIPQDMMIYLAAVTGMRYGEVVGLTLNHIDTNNNQLTISRTWDYKYGTGFKKTKNESSVRTINVTPKIIEKLQTYCTHFEIEDADTPIFLVKNKALASSQINNYLTEKLLELKLPRITFHGLRHTHASVLLYKGVSVLSVSKRLGHSNITTTQSTYLHIIKELENQDQEQILSIIDF
ncbi:tyrosine-type recombinase/integrase [Ligilactobacillus equi]|uniref:tyrosine-type recombinase/integrase n=1 Tax=Ligilactobacillus equi TaxID=137357 RepID=UPI002ED3F291